MALQNKTKFYLPDSYFAIYFDYNCDHYSKLEIIYQEVEDKLFYRALFVGFFLNLYGLVQGKS